LLGEGGGAWQYESLGEGSERRGGHRPRHQARKGKEHTVGVRKIFLQRPNKDKKGKGAWIREIARKKDEKGKGARVTQILL
jgi:hypothetical protein